MILALRSRAPRLLAALVLGIGLALGGGLGRADTLPRLSVQVANGNNSELTAADLAAMPTFDYVTSTVWTDGADRYTGVLLLDLLLQLGVDPRNGPGWVHVSAIDGYSANVDFDLITERAPLLAFLRNGSPMPLRSQGPFWLLFPYDSDPMFRTESIYALSVWQVRQLTIQPR